VVEEDVRDDDHRGGSRKDGWKQCVQGRGALGLDPLDITQTHRPGGRLDPLELLESPFC
jgi:hypothetical protein